MQKSDNARRMTGYLIVSVIGTWVAAYVLAWVLPTQLVVRPGLAQDATDMRSVLGTFALFTATVGALELSGLGVIWRAPRLAVGRVVVLIAGVVTTGILAGAWRSGKPDRLATVGLASGAGAASSWLFLAVMMLGQYYRFNPVEYVFWWGLIGAILGAIGYGAWLLARRLLRPRHSHAPPAHAH